MDHNERPADLPADAETEICRHTMSEDLREPLKEVRDFIERAREHHARTGQWPPDPLLDELEEQRRRVEAEHGNDPRKVLEWHIHAGKRHIPRNGGAFSAASSAGATVR